MKKMVIFWVLLLSLIGLTPKTHAASDIDYEDLFANHQSVMLIIHPITGAIYYANQAAADFYGYPLETLLQMNINDINMLSPDEVAAERLKALEEERNFFIFKHRLSNGDIRTVYVYSYPVVIHGETYLYSIIIDQTAFVIAQDRNRLLTILGITVLVIATITTSYLAIKISKQKRRLTEINEKLHESEQRFKILHDASFGGLAIHDQGIILDCNQALSDITGFSMEELLNSNGLNLIAPAFREMVMQKIKEGYEKPYEAFGIRKNGEIYPLKLEARNLPYRGKKVRVVEFRDITEQKKQDEIKQSLENQWGKLIQEMPLGFNIRELIFDETGYPIDYVFISVNDNYERITGLKRQDIIGKRATEVMPNIETSWIKSYAQIVLEKKTLAIEDYSRALDKYFRVVSYPYKDNQFIVVAEDITERKKQEEQLIMNEAEKSRIIANLPGVSYKCRFDPSWTMVFMSDGCEALTGYHPLELIENKAISFNDLIVPEYRVYVTHQWEEAKKYNRPCNIEYEISKKDGTRIWIWEKGHVYRQDEQWYIEGFLMDISERKNHEDQVIYASKHDFLTGLPNRRYFDEKIKELDRPENYPLLIAMIDIDGLKMMNDTYGHKVGDQAIKHVSMLLSECCGAPSFIARVGGDEFLILSPKTSIDTFKMKRNDLLKKTSAIKIKDIQLSLSFGAAVKNNPSDDIDDMIMFAENNMYANKVLHGQSSRNQVIVALFDALKEKHEEEKIHSDRVSHYCKRIGEKLHLSESDKMELAFAGRMHDIGKIAIPDHILKKPGILTEDEWVTMKTHTTNGYQILRSADQYSKLAEYALTHHERMDGKGYPQGLLGHEIPLFSRIISICDAYEAMTADRPYRKALSKEVAIAELKRCAGTQFDPKLVELFIHEVLIEEE